MTKENEGSYVCEASNDVGEALKQTVSLSVHGKLKNEIFKRKTIFLNMEFTYLKNTYMNISAS